jgi:hypothetical protein
MKMFSVKYDSGRFYVVGPNGFYRFPHFDTELAALLSAFFLNKEAKNPKPCIRCGNTENVVFDADPAAMEIQGDFTPHWLCAECRLLSECDA